MLAEESSAGETSSVSAQKIEKINLREATAISKMAEQLNDSNWIVWCEKMHRIFKVTEVLPYIDSTLPCLDPNTHPDDWKAWNSNDSFAQCLITSNVSDNQMIHIGRVKTAYETWQNLSAVYVPKGHQVATAVLRTYYDTRAREGDDIVQHLSELKELWERLNLFGDKAYQISDTTFKSHIASSLPPSWDTFTESYVGRRVGIVETDLKKLIHSQEFVGIIKEEYLWRKSRTEREKLDQTYYSQSQSTDEKHTLEDCLTDPPKASGSKYSGPTCRNCGHPSHAIKKCWWLGKPKCNKCGYFGHLEKDCEGKGKKRKGGKKSEDGTSKKKKKAEKTEESNMIVCNLEEDEEMNGFTDYDWLADSAMTSHVSNSLEAFTRFQLLQEAKISGVGNIFTQAKGRGTVELESQIDSSSS